MRSTIKEYRKINSKLTRQARNETKKAIRIVDKEKDEWMMCSEDGSCPKEWKEAIDKEIGNTDFDPCPAEDEGADLEIAP